MALEEDEKIVVIAALVILGCMALIGICFIICDPVIFADEDDGDEEEYIVVEEILYEYDANGQPQPIFGAEKTPSINTSQQYATPQQRQRQDPSLTNSSAPKTTLARRNVHPQDRAPSGTTEGLAVIQKTTLSKDVSTQPSPELEKQGSKHEPAEKKASSVAPPKEEFEPEEEEEEKSDEKSISVAEINVSRAPGMVNRFDQVSPLSAANQNRIPAGFDHTAVSATPTRAATKALPQQQTRISSPSGNQSLRNKLVRASSSMSVSFPRYSHKAERLRFIVCNALILVVIACVVIILIISFYED